MKKQLLNEINEMKRLFGYQRGVVISEQLINPSPTSTNHTTPPGNGWTIMSPIIKPMMIKQGYEVKQDSKGNWYYAEPIVLVPDWDKVVKYFSANTDSHWSWVSVEIRDYYETIKMKSNKGPKRGPTRLKGTAFVIEVSCTTVNAEVRVTLNDPQQEDMFTDEHVNQSEAVD